MQVQINSEVHYGKFSSKTFFLQVVFVVEKTSEIIVDFQGVKRENFSDDELNYVMKHIVCPVAENFTYVEKFCKERHHFLENPTKSNQIPFNSIDPVDLALLCQDIIKNCDFRIGAPSDYSGVRVQRKKNICLGSITCASDL